MSAIYSCLPNIVTPRPATRRPWIDGAFDPNDEVRSRHVAQATRVSFDRIGRSA
jgi:hypothetical protein